MRLSSGPPGTEERKEGKEMSTESLIIVALAVVGAVLAAVAQHYKTKYERLNANASSGGNPSKPEPKASTTTSGDASRRPSPNDPKFDKLPDDVKNNGTQWVLEEEPEKGFWSILALGTILQRHSHFMKHASLLGEYLYALGVLGPITNRGRQVTMMKEEAVRRGIIKADATAKAPVSPSPAPTPAPADPPPSPPASPSEPGSAGDGSGVGNAGPVAGGAANDGKPDVTLGASGPSVSEETRARYQQIVQKVIRNAGTTITVGWLQSECGLADKGSDARLVHDQLKVDGVIGGDGSVLKGSTAAAS